MRRGVGLQGGSWEVSEMCGEALSSRETIDERDEMTSER
jgi:hypothetical protein